MPQSAVRNSMEKADHQLKQPSETLNFQKASSHKAAQSTQYHEHIVRRSWDHQNELEPVHTGSRQKQDSSNHTGISAMMQMWQEEKSREQPYNNVGTYTTVSTESAEDKKVSDGHHGHESGGTEKGSSTASKYSGAGCQYLESRR